MNEFDQFVKHKLKVKQYARYTDDFVIISEDRAYLERLLPPIAEFLKSRLALELHPTKVSIKPFHQGVDFLGYIAFPKYRSLRTKTKRRMFRKIKRRLAEYDRGNLSKEELEQTFRSYLGVLSHANAHRLQEEMMNSMPIF